MRTKPLFLFLTLWIYASCVQSQAVAKDDYLDILFTQLWVWEYKNEHLPVGEFGHQGEMVVYFNPDKNYWLFTGEAYGNTGEMIEWILGKPNGIYISKCIDEFGKTHFITDTVLIAKTTQIPEHYLKTLNFKNFSESETGFLIFTAQEFQLNYSKTSDYSSLFLADTTIDFSPIYLFNNRDSETKIPIHFPVDLPVNTKVLEEQTIESKSKIYYKFKKQEHTTYHIKK